MFFLLDLPQPEVIKFFKQISRGPCSEAKNQTITSSTPKFWYEKYKQESNQVQGDFIGVLSKMLLIFRFSKKYTP